MKVVLGLISKCGWINEIDGSVFHEHMVNRWEYCLVSRFRIEEKQSGWNCIQNIRKEEKF